MPLSPLSAFGKAMRLLDRRGYSEHELTVKLSKEGYCESDVAAAVAECRRRGYVNDSLMAGDLAEVLQTRGSGSGLIRLKLRTRGLSENDITAALAECNDGEREAAVRALNSKLRLLNAEKDARKKRDKAFRFMVGRGFRIDLIKRLFEADEFRGFFSPGEAENTTDVF